MDKKIIYYISAMVILFVLSGYFIVYGVTSEGKDISALTPNNATTISATNDSKLFNITLNASANLSASVILYVDDVAVGSNSTVRNNSKATLYSNTSFSEGYHTWYMSITNDTTITTTSRDLIIDTSSPQAPILNYPTSEYNSSSASVTFNISGYDNIGDYYNYKSLKFNITINSSVNKTLYAFGNYTLKGYVTTLADGMYQWNVTVYDNSSNSASSSLQYFRVDTTAPVLANYAVVNVSGTSTTSGNMVARVNFSATDAQLPISSVYVTIFSNNTATNRTGTLTQNTTGSVIMNQIDLLPSDVTYDGVFTIQPHARDSNGNDVTGTNQTNWTKTSLYTGWNLIQVQENVSWLNVSQYSSEITKVSVWNTTSQGYDTFTVGSSTNMANAIKDGDAAYVYVKSNVGLLRKWSFHMANAINLTLSTGWNTLSALNSSIQLYNVCKQTIDNASATIKAVSFYDARVPNYYSQVCSITTGFNNNVSIPRGNGYWLNVNTTTTFMNRR